jgi:hypothetical protein
MANIIQLIQERLNYATVKKVDPNTQEAIKENDSLAQAAIPATLTILYEFSRTKDGAQKILRGNNSPDLLNEILGDKKNDVVQHVADYAGTDEETTETEMLKIAQESARIVQENVGANSNDESVIAYFASQRNDILKSLPAKMQLGQLLNDNMLDDRTNKMEGPVSGFMHKIEQLFAGTPGKDESQ